MWYKFKPIAILDELIAQIRAAPMITMGGFEKELCATWKHLFPITQSIVRIGNLVLDHSAWGATPNPWWKFFTDMPLISEKESEELNRLRRPLVMPHLDELSWMVQERKVIDFRGTVSIHLGNFLTMKLFQTLHLVKTCNFLISCREEIQGILNYMVLWKSDWVASKDLLRRLGWSMIASPMMGSNPMEIPNNYYTQMNLLLWNYRGALNMDFKRRVMEMVVNHFPSIIIITETRVGGDRAAKIAEDLPVDGFFATKTIN